MAQLKSQYDEVRIPLTKMSFTPDVPSASLQPNEYNDGYNIETDVRGIRSVAGDQIFSQFPNISSTTPELLFVTSGFIANDVFVYILAINLTLTGRSLQTYWYYTQYGSAFYDITPKINTAGTFSTYTLSTNITCVWNGNVPIFNDTINPPFFWLTVDSSVSNPMTIYSNTPSIGCQYAQITSGSPTTIEVQFKSPYYNTLVGSGTPYLPGSYATLTNAGVLNGSYLVISSTNYHASLQNSSGLSPIVDITDPNLTISPTYQWNYFAKYLSVTANFLRMYSTPNVGSILVAGGLTYVPLSNYTTTEYYPVTVQWSQAFALNDVPKSWTPTITNVANQLEVPLRGPCQDAFGSNGQFFICSYWDTVVFSPLNYTTTSAPILGVRLYAQGRGMLSSNCWAALDNFVYGIDARDVWVFDGQNFSSLGNQRVKNWLFDQIDPAHYNMVYMIANTEKSQIEIYYPDSTATNGIPNKMLSYRHDLDCWNPPRQVTNAISACESPIMVGGVAQLSSRCITYADANNHQLWQKDQGYTIANASISSSFVRTNIKLLPNYSGKLMVHRMLPEAVNLGATPFSGSYNIEIIPSAGNLSVQLFGSDSAGQESSEEASGTIILNTSNPWIQSNQNTSRLNDIYIDNVSNNSVWMCTAMTFQYTQVEDDR